MTKKEDKEAQSSHKRFVEAKGSLEALAKKQGSDEDYEEKLAPLFDNVLGLVQIATKGDPQKIENFLASPQEFFETLLDDEQGLLRGFMLARSLHEIMDRPSTKDPLEWAKFMHTVIEAKRSATLTQKLFEAQQVREVPGVHKEPELLADDDDDEEIVDELLSRVGKKSEESQGEV